MPTLQDVLQRNEAWRRGATDEDPGFFPRLAGEQRPDLLWIGCSDARVAPEAIAGLAPGEAFVHRNVANLVTPHDPNAGAALAFAVESLRVEHVIVCGHTGCGGATAVIRGERPAGALGAWLRPLQERASDHAERLHAFPDEAARVDALATLNAIDGARAVARTPVVTRAWAGGQRLGVHAWTFALADGALRPTPFSVFDAEEVETAYVGAVATVVPVAPGAHDEPDG